MARHQQYSAKTVVGIFRDRPTTERAIDELLSRGFDRDHISVVMRGAEETREFARGTGVKETRVAKGAGVGATEGGAAGILAGLDTLAIPGLGPILAAGPIVAGIAGVLGGGAAGGLTGGLIDLGVPEEEAKTYKRDVVAGNILVAVQCGDLCESAGSILERSGAINYARQRTMGGPMPRPEAHAERPMRPTGPQPKAHHEPPLPHVERTAHHEEGRHDTKH